MIYDIYDIVFETFPWLSLARVNLKPLSPQPLTTTRPLLVKMTCSSVQMKIPYLEDCSRCERGVVVEGAQVFFDPSLLVLTTPADPSTPANENEARRYSEDLVWL